MKGVWLRLLLGCVLLTSLAHAAEPGSASAPPSTADAKPVAPPPPPPSPPRLLLALPFAVATGTTNTIQLRGLNLTNLAGLRFEPGALDGLTVTNLSSGRADAWKDQDATKVGDTRVDVSVVVPAGLAMPLGRTNALVAMTPAGESGPWPLWVLPADSMIDEKEPNGGWHDAPIVSPRRYIRGTIQEASDVDVFRWAVRAGQRLRVQVHAASMGSSLDSIVTLYDEMGNILAANDDVAGERDSVMEWRCPRDGIVAIAVQDAHDKGGPAHVYVLEISAP